MRKKVGIWVVLGVTSVALAACGAEESDDGGSVEAPATVAEIEIDAGSFDSEEDFAAAVTDYCDQRGQIAGRTPVLGVNAPGLEAEFANLQEQDQQDVEKLQEFQPPESLRSDWEALIAATQSYADLDGEVLDAAAGGDAEEANATLATKDANAAFDAYEDATLALGEDYCGRDEPAADDEILDTEIAASNGEVPDDLLPSDTIEEAADEYLAAQGSEDCADVVASSHSQTYVKEADLTCPTNATFAESGELIDSAQWGPIGAATFAQPDATPLYVEFIYDEATGEFGATGGFYVTDGGLQPANEDIDADAVAGQVIDAIKADDPDAFNATLTEDVSPEGQSFDQTGASIEELGDDPVYGKRIVDDIRGSEAAPELIVANQARAYYLVETEATTYVLVLTHQPGTPSGYRFTGYWALTE